MYEKIGEISEPRRLALLKKAGPWAQKRGFSACVLDGRRMFVKIPPGGSVHAHTDDAREKLHIVLRSAGALCRSGDEWYELKERGIYRMDPKIEHESANPGAEDRIHLVLS